MDDDQPGSGDRFCGITRAHIDPGGLGTSRPRSIVTRIGEGITRPRKPLAAHHTIAKGLTVPTHPELIAVPVKEPARELHSVLRVVVGHITDLEAIAGRRLNPAIDAQPSLR